MMVPDTLRSSSCEDLCSNIHFHQTRPNRMIDGQTNMQKPDNPAYALQSSVMNGDY